MPTKPYRPLDEGELAALRQDYAQRTLTRAELETEPLAQFAKWLAEAQAAEILEPNAMIVATVDEDGQPWTRTVLLKACDARGFTFFTNYDGAKARQIAGNAKVALTFLWAALERQVNVTGRAIKSPREESAAYFASRPRLSQLGAWASRQSEVVESRAVLERKFEELGARFGDGEIPLPENWGGYCVAPETVEFWQGRRSRLHDRLRYVREDGSWRIERLSP